MTDNTQAELDEILRRLVNRVERYAFEKWDSQPKDYPPGFRDVLFTQDMEDEATEAIIDWHNKQMDYVIGEKDESDITVLRQYLPEDKARHIRDRNYARNFLRAEQRQRAERNKLKEVK